ncbi:MFS transporter [Streptomyces sp. AJS327]|uniref:MFS transporter n=1 Tax=Streptomyces sp. AJS327 TaxID=2545265 RepID=UPI0015DF2FEC|nr:MFS transporter [Streptomyces sp. AJS327]
MSTTTSHIPAARSRGLDRAQRGAFLGALIGWIFDYYEVFLMTLLVVPIAKEFDLGSGQVGLLLGMQLLFMGVGGVLFGWLADRIGRKKVLIITIAMFSVFTFARALSPSYEVLLILTCVAAIGIGGEYGVGQTLVAEIVPPHRRGWWSGLLYGGVYVGIVAGSLVGGYLMPEIGWRWTFVISGLPVLFALWVRRHTPESEVWASRVRQTSEGRAERTRISPAIVRVWLLCVLAASLQFFAYYGIASFLPSYLVEQGSSVTSASTWLLFTAVAGGVGCFIGSYLSDRLGRRKTLFLLSLLAFVSGLALVATWDQLLDGGTWVRVVFFAFFVGANGPAVFGALFSESFPADIRATAVSSSLQLARSLSFFPPIVAAALVPSFGYQPIVLAAGIMFGCLAALSWTFTETNGKQLTT